ncbi:hypothetical protein EIN_002150 [Entamoeba invadens IP1]|uniref:Uncharacterized protein n=1 Tax=Entamoeba invadens IP1 TaxID=370355 RepID=L7FJX5_ENTIV|nr:hypothetical protein EIN_002150 [Entamoeba invadens IP1]ELP83564.1 hypothetical protein EIN_002150 [Entamoeba invadens IP1]|eukprot:XP_004182910.1 hypothetical protein EIN_002150 [Entamoeba invadens IP1]
MNRRLDCIVCLIGAKGVGKTTTKLQFEKQIFKENYVPNPMEDSYIVLKQVDGIEVYFILMDESTEYKELTKMIYKNCDCFVFIYSILSIDSFNELESFKEYVLNIKNNEKIVMVLCESKCDLEPQRVVSQADGERLALNWNVPFYSCSARTRINIDEMFIDVAKQYIKLQREKKELQTIAAKKKKGCVLV